MERSFLSIKNSTANSSVKILESEEHITCNGVPLVTVGSKTFCHICQQEGHIVAVGERPNVISPHGHLFALEGDTNHCGCANASVFKSENHLKTGGDKKRITRSTDNPQCEYLNGKAKDIVVNDYNKPDRDNTITQKSEIKTMRVFSRNGKAQPALQYDINVNDHHPISIFQDSTPMNDTSANNNSISIFQGSNPVENKLVRPSVEQVIDALRLMPYELYRPIRTINITSFVLNPSKTTYGTATLSEFYEKTGSIDLYPYNPYKLSADRAGEEYSDQLAQTVVTHEAAHTFMNALFIARLEKYPDNERFWSNLKKQNMGATKMAELLLSDYQSAIKQDTSQHVPSQYARRNMTEDFAESLMAYFLARGTPCEEVFKKLYPNRYKFFYDLIYEEEIYNQTYDKKILEHVVPKQPRDELR